MQTEEETAAAEEPILEEGSEREQVNGITSHLSRLSFAFVQSCTFFAPPRATWLLVITHPCLSLTCVSVYVHKSRFSPSRVAPVQGHHSGPWLGEEPSRGLSESGREGGELA